MDESHDPLQLMKQLRQILAADKLSVGFFLGAGCPSSIWVPSEDGNGEVPLIPDITGLTKTVTKTLSNLEDLAKPFCKLCNILKEDGFETPNIEVMLSRIRSLREAAGAAEVRGLSAGNLEELDLEICKSISKIVTKTLPNKKTPYHSLARFVGSRLPPSEIFTTNYDLLAEQALESLQIPFFDGFVGSSRPFFDQHAIEDDLLPERWSLLWKLHGSINWRFNRDTKVISRSVRPEDGDELLIHPSHLKYDESRRMPYLVMLDRLKMFLRNMNQPVALFIIGHSFSDEHLNATVMESLKANPNSACFALQFGNLSDYPAAVKLAKNETSLNLLARDKGIIRTSCSRWGASAAMDAAEIIPAFMSQEEGKETGPRRVDPRRAADRSSDEPRIFKFILGDFKSFGLFLEEVAGTAYRSEPRNWL